MKKLLFSLALVGAVIPSFAVNSVIGKFYEIR